MRAGDRLIFGTIKADKIEERLKRRRPPLHPQQHAANRIRNLGRPLCEKLRHVGRRAGLCGGSVFHLYVRATTHSWQPPGARRIIKTLSHTGAVGCLILGYNNLGDEGCAELLKYLRSEEGQRHKIASILLNANGLGNVALNSLGGFLRGNKSLKELYLPSVSLNIPTGTNTPDSYIRRTISSEALMSLAPLRKHSTLRR